MAYRISAYRDLVTEVRASGHEMPRILSYPTGHKNKCKGAEASRKKFASAQRATAAPFQSSLC